MIPIGQRYSLELNHEALEIYYDKYKDKLHKLVDCDYEEFSRHNQDFDVYGLYCDNKLIGCVYFEVLNDWFVFHVAVEDEYKGKWTFIWPRLKQWMINKYKFLLSVTHKEDAYTSRLMKRAGFTFIEETKNFYWWKLWVEQQAL